MISRLLDLKATAIITAPMGQIRSSTRYRSDIDISYDVKVLLFSLGRMYTDSNQLEDTALEN